MRRTQRPHLLPRRPAGVAELAPLAPGLRSLSLQSCVRLTNRCTASIAALTQLARLNLRGCLQLSDEGVAALGALVGLEDLSLQGACGVRGEQRGRGGGRGGQGGGQEFTRGGVPWMS